MEVWRYEGHASSSGVMPPLPAGAKPPPISWGCPPAGLTLLPERGSMQVHAAIIRKKSDFLRKGRVA